MSIFDLITILDIDVTGTMIPAGRLVIEKLRKQYSIKVNYNVRADRWGTLDIYFNDPKQEVIFRLKYSEYL